MKLSYVILMKNYQIFMIHPRMLKSLTILIEFLNLRFINCIKNNKLVKIFCEEMFFSKKFGKAPKESIRKLFIYVLDLILIML